MNAYQQQYYMYIDSKRRQIAYKNYLMRQNLSIVRQAVDHGVIPWEDPEIKKYWLLLTEDDKDKIITEVKEWCLTLEKDTEDPKV